MMTIVTRKALTFLVENYANKELTYEELRNAVIASGISMGTFRRYMRYNAYPQIRREEASIEEVLDLLNSCAGNDCEECEWEYHLVDGKIYNEYSVTLYRILNFIEG